MENEERILEIIERERNILDGENNKGNLMISKFTMLDVLNEIEEVLSGGDV